MEEVTVTATADDAGATFAIAPADANSGTSGHQVTLPVGETAITGTVTAEDDSTTKEYAITVTRAAVANNAPTITDIGNIADAIVGIDKTVIISATDADVGDTLQYKAESSDTTVATVIPTDFKDLTSGASIVTVSPKGAGSSTVTVTVSDGTVVDNVTDTFIVTVTANTAPTVTTTVIDALTLNALSNTDSTVDISTHFKDSDTGDSLTYSIDTDAVGYDAAVAVEAEDAAGNTASKSFDVTIVLPSLTLSAGTLTIAEDGGTDTYTVVLDSEPTGTVTVSSTDTSIATVNTSTLTFTTGDWDTAQTVTVTGVNDDVDNATARSTTITNRPSGADYGSVSTASVSVTLTDDDTAGITLSETALTLTEDGGTETYTVVLDSEPTGTVTVSVASTDTSVVTVNTGTLTFTTGDWDTPQMVTVTGVNDDVDNAIARTTTITNGPSGADYDGVSTASVSVTLTDDDTAGITLSETALTGVDEDGGNESYTVVLDSEPTCTVTESVASTDTSIAIVDKGTLMFTTGDRDTAQTVTVTGVNDDVDNATARTSTITNGPSGANYDGVSTASVSLTLTDDDTKGVTVTGSPLTVDEGSTATYTVVLDSEPMGTVIITPTSSDTAIVTVSTSREDNTLQFTASNWDTTQSVTVRAWRTPALRMTAPR